MTNTQPRITNRMNGDTIIPLFVEQKLNPVRIRRVNKTFSLRTIFSFLQVINERTALAKSLVQSALDDAFRKETFCVQLERYWPLILKKLNANEI